jgi:2-polyprenyl-6-methoxyphenol hydroxylase-like FAD-dependent oxidoreductase
MTHSTHSPKPPPLSQDAPIPQTPEARVQEALSAVAGWSWGIEDVVRATPPEALVRSRIRDRWTAGALGRGRVTLAGDAAHPMTPNLGQGGCAALEDSVVLARELKAALNPAGGSSGGSSSSGGGGGSSGYPAAAVEAALRRYEAERRARCLPLTVRSWVFGALLQLPYPPVTLARDAFMAGPFNPAHFLDHTAYDCGVIV